MNFNEYRPLALRTAKMFPTARENLRHAALGLLTEIGEFATEVKRIVVYGKPMTEEMRLHMIEEIGDAQWYVPLGLLANGDSRQSIAESQLAFLRSEINGAIKGDLAEMTIYLGTLTAGVAASLATGSMDEDRSTICDLLLGIVYVIDAGIAPILGVHPDDIRAQNIAKLRLRFPDAYSDQAAEARADKGGLDARSS